MSEQRIHIDNLRTALRLAIEALRLYEEQHFDPGYKTALRAGFEQVLAGSENRGEPIVIVGQHFENAAAQTMAYFQKP